MKEEKALRMFQFSIDQAPDAVFWMNRDGSFSYVNENACRSLGYTRDELLGLYLWDIDPVYPKELWETQWVEFQQDGQIGTQHVETFHRRKDGVVFPVEVSARHIWFGDTELHVAFVRDITERRQVEEKLKLTQSAIDHASIGCFWINKDSHLSYVNEQACRSLGYSREELLGMSVTNIDPDYPQDVWADFWPRLFESRVQTFETIHQRKDGSRFPVEVTANYVEFGGEEYCCAYARDITERKQSEDALRESEEKYRELVENINEAIFVTDTDGKLMYISPVIESVTGYRYSEIIGQKYTALIHHSDLSKLEGRFQKLLDGDSSPFEYRIITKSGQTKWVRSSSRPVYAEGKLTGIRGMLVDISDSKKAEEEQKKLRDQLRQAQKMEAIGTLAGGIAHDFNNILSAVMGYTELSLNQIEKGTSLYANLKEVFQAGERAKNLVNQILAFSRQAEQEIKPLEIKLIAKEALKFLRASLPTTIDIRQDFQSDSLVMADPTQIHQVIMNLCTNAGHAMRKKGGVLQVKLTDVELDGKIVLDHPELKPGKYLELSVNDTGHGIPERILDRIFDPFFTTKEMGEGTGMGLAVVHGIVGSYGGMITASSEPGRGSTFKVYLPAVKRQLEPVAEPMQPIPTGTERILFVDDEPALVHIGKQTLESLGYQVTTRTSSIEALELFKAKPDGFDLVITDMTMPNMTGDELAAQLMQIRPEIPIILCTGYSSRINQEQATSMGVRAFISKPVLRRELAETIRELLDGE